MVKDIKTGAESYVGLTLKVFERYAGDTHENYFALVWDNGAAKEIFLGHTGYGWSFTAEPDAPELLAAYEADEKAKAQRRAIAAREEQALAQANERARTPLKGAKVRVFKGRKIPVGTTGEIIWYGETQYGMRVGLVPDGEPTPDGKPLWTAADNVEVTTPAPDGAPGPSTLEARINRPARPYTPGKKKVTAKGIVLDADGDYRIMFPYDPDLREELKSFFPRRRWDRDHTAWIVPGLDRAKILEFAGQHGFDLTEPSEHLTKVVIDGLSDAPEELFEVVGELEATIDATGGVTIAPKKGPGAASAQAWAEIEVERILAEEVAAEVALARKAKAAQAEPTVSEPAAPARTPEGWLIIGEATVGTTGGKKK